MSTKYEQRGVSATKSEVHDAIQGLDKGLYPKAFCKVLPDIAGGDPEYCNVMHADTAGTKTSLAYLYWKETGDLSVWEGIVQDSLVMNLDDMGCVGAVDNILISSTIGRNKNRIPGEVLKTIIQGAQKFADRMAEQGVGLHLTGGETADVGDIVRTIDVGYTTFARLRRDEVIVNDIRPGNVIVGLASYGQATYEDEYNGGMGSNGLTSARHDVFRKEYADKYPESFDPEVPREVVYTGSRALTDKITVDGVETTVGKLVLSPTRTYLPVLKKLLQEVGPGLSGLIHCTGGAQTKVVKFIDPDVRVVKDKLFPAPPLFDLIRQESGTDWREMYQVFNMGHRLEAYVGERDAQTVIDLARSFGIDARIIGHVEAGGEQASVRLTTPGGVEEYTD
ncbi:phosphoribosylformylglycinamidine cyclo-ligase [Lewinella marina]|uniref:Phosphoribosylformylglycinamidine cyclo-ligase n=1 Tax=Neolewinella marina TaxID=438751 RepID=A0A2G0CJ78_9BACT|nr:AIR synthase related protein [Neolewinella marina]NJB84821.1 phosphoribosylformylglycinamidine cyclo-ligase [Neolewinella marina]PHL00022.1 phosphoribosylformylglycinamidine cyclo-ligase [Neolewinella marina]